MSDEEWAEVPGSEGTILVQTLPDGSARYRVAVEAVPALVEGLRGKLKVAEAEIAALRDALEGMCRAHCIYTTRGLFPGNEVEEEAFRLLGWEKPHPATPIGPTGPTGPAG